MPETPFPVVKLADLYKGLEEDFGYVVDDSEKGDLTTEAERLSYDWVKKHYNHEFLFVTDYDAEKRAFYHMRDENGVPQGYDLIWRGVEITTGAQREHLSLIHICGKVNDILRAGHQSQQAVGCKKANKSHQHAAHKAQGNSGLHRFVHALVILCAIAAGSHNVCTQRKADKQVDQQVDERTVGTNCCPVSYTHLDVYKRQHSGSVPRWRSCCR